MVCFLQYLKDEDEDLVSPPNMDGNQWVTFLKQSTHLKGEVTFPIITSQFYILRYEKCNVCLCWFVADSSLLFPTYPQKSLHFVKKMMEATIDLCLQKPAVSF